MKWGIYMCLVYLFIPAQAGCVMNDSVLTQVEGYSRMGGKEWETETDSNRDRDRKRVREWIIDDTNFSQRVIKMQEIGVQSPQLYKWNNISVIIIWILINPEIYFM